jgi:hypothetical protein
MAELPGVEKQRRNQHGNYGYAGHEDVTAAIRHLYVKHGVVRTYEVERYELTNHGVFIATVNVHFVNIDEPTDRIVVPVAGIAPCTTKNGSPTAQQAGVAISYAIKNAEFKTFSLKGDDTPDPNDDVYDGAVQAQTELEDFVASFKAATTLDEVNDVAQRVSDARHLLGARRDAIKTAYVAATKRVGED